MTTVDKEYVLGTNDAELWRLGYQHRVWLESAAAIWERAGFTLGQTLLDVGCGPGYATLDLAHLVGPDGRVLGFDVSDRFVSHASTVIQQLGMRHVEISQCDVQILELPAESIDGAYARWVLCFVNDPESVIERVACALKPGGRFAIQDYSFYSALSLVPPSDIMRRVIDAVGVSWRDRGGDPEVARKLPAMLVKHGLEVVDVRPLVRIAKPGSPLWNWPTTFFRNYLPVLESLGLLSAEECDAWRAMWRQYSADPNARFTTPPMLDIVAEKPGARS